MGMDGDVEHDGPGIQDGVEAAGVFADLNGDIPLQGHDGEWR